MAATNITYNSFDLQDANWKTRLIRHKQMPDKVLDLQPIARDDSYILVNTYYPRKEITIEGTLVCTTNADLRTKLDNMKTALRTNEQNLDIDYGGSVIRYTATVSALDVPDDYYHITLLPFSVTFMCEPFGKATTTNSLTASNVTAATYTNTINVTGSADPKPTIKVTIDAETSMTKVKFENTTTSESITVSQSLSAADVIEIDCENKSVEVNSTEVDFLGQFPAFNPDTNSFTITTTDGGAFQYDLYIEYYPSYL